MSAQYEARYVRGTGGVCTFVVFTDPPHEFVHAGPLDHEHVVHHALDRDRNDVVGAVHRLRSYGDTWVGGGGKVREGG